MLMVGIIGATTQGAKLSIEISLKITVDSDVQIYTITILQVKINGKIRIFIAFTFIVDPYPSAIVEHIAPHTKDIIEI
jgi:hypothetical protein